MLLPCSSGARQSTRTENMPTLTGSTVGGRGLAGGVDSVLVEKVVGLHLPCEPQVNIARGACAHREQNDLVGLGVGG